MAGRLSFENLTFGRRPLGCDGKATSAAALFASESRARRSQRPQHVEKQHAREPGDFSGVPPYRDRSGKAICRTPDMNAVEGSGRAVVPMKLPNKEALSRLGGGGGGKSADQGERCGPLHEPDTERGSPCPRGYAACAKWRVRFDASIQG